MSASAMATADLYAMLDARRVELGLSQLQLGQLAFGRPDSSRIQSLRRGSSPTFDRLSQLCDALGYELYCGPPRARRAAVGSERPAEVGSPDPAPTAPRYRPLPWHRLAPASGASPLAFPPDWGAKVGHAMAGLAVVAPDICHVPCGPSLETVLAVVDADAQRNASPHVWAFLERGRVVIARIQTHRQALLIHDSDPAVGVRLLTGTAREATTMVGKVVWMGQAIGTAQTDSEAP